MRSSTGATEIWLNTDSKNALDGKQNLSLTWHEAESLEEIQKGNSYVVISKENGGPSDNAFWYSMAFFHPASEQYKKVLLFDAFNNQTFINTKNNGEWLGWIQL